jgi:hypothetical protein
MSETTPPLAQPEAPRFDPVEAAVGVITRPVATMEQVAAARPWRFALVLYAALMLLSGLASFAAPTPDLADDALSPDGLAEMEAFYAFLASPAFAVVLAALGPLFLVAWSGLLYAVGRLLGGRGAFGAFGALLATQGFTAVPTALLAPVTAVLHLAGPLLEPLVWLLSAVFYGWMLALSVVGIRASLALSTGRAVAAALLPLLVLFALAFALFFVLILWAITASLAASGS